MTSSLPVSRAVLPIPDQLPTSGFKYDATDPGKAFPPIVQLRPPAGAPNVIIALIDDCGFGASTTFGGPCETATAERLAAGGLKYNRFHTTALCSPTRQAMLTGRNHHAVGMGAITELATSAPGYNSIRPNSAAPLAEVLMLNGYSTAQFGKCHEVPVWETSPMGPFRQWPTGSGFEHFYGFIGGETNQYYPAIYNDTVPVEPDRTPEEGYHFTEDMTDHAIEWVRQQKALMPDKPFFGQVIGVNRFFDDRVHGQSTSPTFNVVSWKCTQVWLTTPGLAWFYITVRDEQFWTPMMSYLDFHRVRDADADVGGMRLSAYCRDWRRLGPAAWLDLMEERELGGPIVAPPAPPVLVVLAEDDFAAAVRNALRDLARPDRLTTNPLTASRVVTDQSTHATPADIAEVLRFGLASLPDDPRTDKARRALERTYFHGAVSQETAAEVLGMAFSTYRRHLRAGTDMLVGTLWQWELYGRTP